MSATTAKLRTQIIVAHDREETMRGATGEERVSLTLLAMNRADQMQASRGWPKALPAPKEHWAAKAKKQAAYRLWTLATRTLDRIEQMAYTVARKAEEIADRASRASLKAHRRRAQQD